MVNQFRTCLLNLPAWSGSTLLPGEDYIPATYAPPFLTTTLSALQSLIFGPGADRVGMNLTIARILTYLSASQFAADVTKDDSRITYNPQQPVNIFGSIGPSASGSVPVAGWAGVAAFYNPGQGYATWTVTIDVHGNYTVSYDDTSVSGSSPPSGPGSTVWLPGSQLGVVLPASTAGTWIISLLAPPSYSFVAAAGATDVNGVFQPNTPGAEANWAAVWDSNAIASDRAAALCLAVSARIYDLVS